MRLGLLLKATRPAAKSTRPAAIIILDYNHESLAEKFSAARVKGLLFGVSPASNINAIPTSSTQLLMLIPNPIQEHERS